VGFSLVIFSKNLTKFIRDSLNPIIQIHAFDQKRHSKTKKNTGTAMTYWGEHVYFIKKFQSDVELETQKLKLEIYDDKLIGSDALVGDFEIDIINIYHAENHSYQHKWLALSNFEKGLSEIKGYILISANVLTSGDNAIELNDYQPSEGSGSEPKVLMPPHLETKPWQMKISLIRAESLIKMDIIGSIDCYLLFNYAGARFKTDVIKDNRNPVWAKNIYVFILIFSSVIMFYFSRFLFLNRQRMIGLLSKFTIMIVWGQMN